MSKWTVRAAALLWAALTITAFCQAVDLKAPIVGMIVFVHGISAIEWLICTFRGTAFGPH